MNWQTKLSGAVALFATVCIGGQTFGSVLYSGPYVGQNVTFSNVMEASGDPATDPEPLFGNPKVISPNTLDFDPSSGAFASAAPPPDTTDGSLVFRVASNDGSNLNQFTFTAEGDYQFFGASPNGEFVGDTINVTFRDAVTEAPLLNNQNGQFFESFDAPVNGVEQGSWKINFTTSLSNFQTDSVIVELDDTLVASSTTGNTASIRKKNFQVGVTTTVVPEPASLALLALGGLAIAAPRQRRRG